METPDRKTADSLIGRLTADPYSFDFFLAVRRIECLRADLPRIGATYRPEQDAIRFKQEPSLAFAPSTLSEFRPLTESKYAMTIRFFGQFGPNGALPLHLTEFALERRDHHNDPTIPAFMDLFHHRLLSLFYRAWAVNQQTVSYDRRYIGSTQDRLLTDRYAAYVGSLIGIGMPELLNADSIQDNAKYHYAGRVSSASRHPEGLRAVLQDYFKIPVEIEEFTGRWLSIPQDCRCRLGESPDTGALGKTTLVGSRFWDRQGKFTLHLGPMTFADYQRMLPGGASLERLTAWIDLNIGPELCWQARLILKAEEVPTTKLGSIGHLGYTTWLKSQPTPKDADDLIYQSSAA